MRDRTSATGGGNTPRVDGKFLSVDGHRFLVKGVAYGTFAPDADGVQFPSRERIAADFAQMAACGINTVRTYTVPPEHLLDEASRHGLRVFAGIPWAEHVAFLDDGRLVQEIRRDSVEAVRRLASHPAMLLFAVGNEIPPAIVRWHGQQRVERFLRELCDEMKGAAPDSLLTYVNFPPTEYLDLDCFDVCAFNVYLHRERDLRAYLARLQNVAGVKPLLLAEAGADSIREGLDGQARITAMHLRAAFAEGACGAVAFSWTDEWWRGGHDVTDWAFGLVDAERLPKPAAAAVARMFREAPFAEEERTTWPTVSVVVCAYNAADTIDECLRSLAALTYPDYEVIVVNDGSRDATGQLAHAYPGVRVVDIPNGGLSAARNVGLAEATGEIVAYTDSDVRVDPDWLTYLVQPFLTSDVVGSGGPNIVPADDPWIAQCVARAPGGPVHVLLDDRTAEHVPGCNMAFRREALLGIGGFNPTFLRAGDDVDVCWRLQARGLRIGFAPAALVWHHHRNTVGAYWRQQVGYGEGETWLVGHHPEKFAGSDMLWRGRIYSPLPWIQSFTRLRVNTGVWGTAPFPSIYNDPARSLTFFLHSPAWFVVSTALLVAGGVAMASATALDAALLISAGSLGWLTTVVRCVLFARRTDISGLPSIGEHSRERSALIYRSAIAWMHFIQPLARIRGRIRGMGTESAVRPRPEAVARPEMPAVTSLGDIRRAVRLLLGRRTERLFWSESWVNHPTLLATLAEALGSSRPSPVVSIDDGWRVDRDLSLAAGRWAWLDARVLVEEHAQGRCLVRVGTRLRPGVIGTLQGLALALPLVMTASAAAALDWPSIGAVAALSSVGLALRAIWQTAGAHAAFERAWSRAALQAGMTPLPSPPVAASPVRRYAPTAVGVFQRVTVAMLVLTIGLGVFSFGRVFVDRRGAVSADATATQFESSGGVAVGLAGDLFVAESGLIERLRPRPPADATLTADEIGSGLNPLLGTPVPFDTATDIALAPDGDLYVADAGNNRVCRIERSSAQVTTIAGGGRPGFAGDGGLAARAALRGPAAVAVAPNGDLYIADALNHRVRVIAKSTGRIRTMAGDGVTSDRTGLGDGRPAVRAHLDRPSGLAVAPNGDVYIADTGHHRVRRVDIVTGIITTIAGDGTPGTGGDDGPAVRANLSAPMGLAVVPSVAGPVVYVADSQNDRVRVIDATGRISALSGAEPLLTPVRLAYHPAGWLYVKDSSPDGVTAIAVAPPLPAAVSAVSRPFRRPRS